MSKFKNDSLTRSGQVCAFNVAVHGCDDERRLTRSDTGCFIYPYGNSGRQRVTFGGNMFRQVDVCLRHLYICSSVWLFYLH